MIPLMERTKHQVKKGSIWVEAVYLLLVWKVHKNNHVTIWKFFQDIIVLRDDWIEKHILKDKLESKFEKRKTLGAKVFPWD